MHRSIGLIAGLMALSQVHQHAGAATKNPPPMMRVRSDDFPSANARFVASPNKVSQQKRRKYARQMGVRVKP